MMSLENGNGRNQLGIIPFLLEFSPLYIVQRIYYYIYIYIHIYMCINIYIYIYNLLYIQLTFSSCYSSISLALGLIGRDGDLSFLCHGCGFTCQQRVLKTFPGTAYLRSKCGVVRLWHLILNLSIYIYIYIYIYMHIFI